MTLRDRLVVTAVVVIAIVGAAWVLVVSPERKQANQLATQVAGAKAKLASAESKLATARQAATSYASAYASIVSMGKAVPTGQEVPGLVYELSQASKREGVKFQSISVASGTAASSPASAGSSASASAAANAASAGFAQVPLTLMFSGSFSSIEHMLRGLTDLATRTPAGTLEVNGRLLTVQSVVFSSASEPGKHDQLTASVTATAYQLPPEASTATPASTGTGSTASSSAAASPTAAAIVKANP